jgi:DNA-binding beta-propeller fold protein YncE
MLSHVRRIVLLLAALSLACVSFPAYAQTDWAVVDTFHVGGPGGWDYLTVDSQTHRLYVPRTTHTLVIDAESGKTIADIPGQKNAHGVALAPKVGRGFISDGGGNGAIVIFDLKTNVVLGSITAKEDADGIIYDPNSDQILVVTGRGKALMSFKPDLDPKNGKIDEPIPLGGEPEFLAADATGKAYVNLMDTHQVAVIDLRTRRVIANWPVAPGGLPVGMAIDSARGRLFIGCRGPQKLVVMSTRDGKVISDLPIGESVDAVKVDSAQVFASTAGGVLSVQSETSPGSFAMVQSVKTGEGARTMGVDSGTHRIYLPSAVYETGANGLRSPVPGSFMILVVARQGAR